MEQVALGVVVQAAVKKMSIKQQQLLTLYGSVHDHAYCTADTDRWWLLLHNPCFLACDNPHVFKSFNHAYVVWEQHASSTKTKP